MVSRAIGSVQCRTAVAKRQQIGELFGARERPKTGIVCVELFGKDRYQSLQVGNDSVCLSMFIFKYNFLLMVIPNLVRKYKQNKC